MLKKAKLRLLKWLLEDKELEEFVADKVIGDAEVLQYFVTDVKDLKIENCILHKSTFSGNKISSMSNNLIKGISFINNDAG